MDFKLTEQQEALKKKFDDFFVEEMKNAPQGFSASERSIYTSDEAFQFHRYMMKTLGEKGWLSRPWPKEYGGEDAPLIEQLIFNEVRAARGAPGVDGFGVCMFAPTIMIGATDEQKKRLLPPIAKGEVVYCQGWSEPDAGSDLANLQTTAIKEGDHYVVNGQKVWTSGAHKSDCMFLLARTDPESTRSRGLSVFHLRMDYPGIETRPIYYMNGIHQYNEVWFKDVKIPVDDLIGPENQGWRLTRETMNFERSGVGRFAEARVMLQEIIDYVKETKRDGKLLSENPVVRQKLAKIFIDIEVGHLLAYKVAFLQQEGGMEKMAPFASGSKVFGTELIQRISMFTTEIMGLYGQLTGSDHAPLRGIMPETYMTSIGSNIAAGTSEIQRNIMAWTGLGLPRFK